MAKDKSLFPEQDPYGLGNSVKSLFPDERPMRVGGSSSVADADKIIRAANKPPTKKQLAAIEEANQQQFFDGVRNQLNMMRETPEWSNASLDRRKEMYDTWRKGKFQSFMQQYQDPKVRQQLNRIVDETLNQDIKILEKAVDDSSWWKDRGIGVATNAERMLTNMKDIAPASRYQGVYDNLKAILDEGREPSYFEAKILLGPAREIYNDVGDWNKTLAEVERRIGGHLAENKEHRDSIKELEKNLSIAHADKQIRSQELKDESGAVLGTARDLLSGANLPATIIEQSPSIVPTILAARGGVVPVTMVGAGLSGQDALGTAFDQVMNMPQDQLDMSEPYRELVDSGVDPDTARQRLAARVASGAVPLAMVVGAAMGPIGPEAAVAKALSTPVAKAAPTTLTRALTNAGAKTGVSSLSAATDNAATQLSANLAQQRGVGEDSVDTMFNVAEAGTLGFALGSALGGPSHITAEVRSRGATQGDATNNTPTDNTQNKEGSVSDIVDIPSASDAVAETATQAQPSDQTITTQPSEALVAELQETFNDLRQRSGQTVTMDELAPVLQKLYDAQEQGIPADAINRGLDAVNDIRAMSPESGHATLRDAYADYMSSRVASDITDVAAEATQNLNNITEETLDGGTTETRTTEPVTDSTASDSRVEAPTTRDTEVTTESINDAIQDGSRVAEEQVSGTQRDDASQNESNAQNDATLGTVEPASQPISGPDNSINAATTETIGTGERSGSGTTRPSTADGGSTAGTGVSTNGLDSGAITVGQEVQFQAAFPNAPVLSGTVESVNGDGTFNMRNGSSVLGNLPISRIMTAGPASGEATQAGAVTGGEPALGVIQPANPPASDATTTTTQEAIQNTTQEQLGSTTPEGRDTTQLNDLAERLYDYKNGEYAPDAMELQNALERGDYVAVDQISSYLYSQGLRQYAPPNKPTGVARNEFAQQMEKLSSFDRQILRNEYDSLRDSLPAEMRDHDAFVNTMVQDALLANSGNAPLSSVYARLSKFARDVINKIAKGLASIALVLTLSNTIPINDAVAATGGGTVNAVTQTQGFSETANVVNSWVTQTKDNAGQKYVIADKASGEIHIMDAKGNVLASAPALYGKKVGDGMTVGETPAGIFTLTQESAPQSYGGDIQHFADAPNGDIYAIHRVLTGNPKQNRLGRLASKTADDNRVSLGCINIPAAVYDQHLSSGFKGKLYIIPDQKELGSVFKGIEEIQAKQDLKAGEVLPDDFQSHTTTVYESSTVNKAVDDLASKAPVDGTSLTATAMEMGVDISTTPMAEPTNNAADSGYASAALLPLIVAMRNRRRVRNSGKLGDDSNNIDGESAREQGATPTPDMGPNAVNGEMRHTVKATDAPADTSQARATRDWVTNGVVRIAEKLSDSSKRFTEWTSQFVEPGREADSHALNVTYKLAANQIRQMQQRFMSQHIDPLFETLREVSTRMGRAIDVVGDHYGVWATLQHIPEANAALRRKLEAQVRETMFTDPEAYAKAYADLRAHDDYQAGVGPQVPMAGGLTDAQARVLAQRIEGYGYDVESLQAFQKRLVDSFQQLLDERVKAGAVTEEQARAWREENNFENYVPLYVDKTTETGGDVFMGSAMYNPAGEHARNGSLAPANHALVTLHQYISRTAAGIGSLPFKARLHALYEELKATGDTRGLRRIAVNSDFVSKEDSNAVGLIYRDPYINADDAEAFHVYKYVWDDPRIAEGILRSNSESNLGVLRNMAAVTNVHARLITKYDPSFAPFNWVRDGWERATSITSKQLYDADGNAISIPKAARKLYVGALNPIHVAKIAANIVNPNLFADSKTIQAMNQLRELGGLTTYNNAMAMNAKNMRAALRRTTGLKRHIAMLDNFFTQWNEAFGAAPAVGAFLAGLEMGVPAREMAFRVLDTFNTNNRGEWTGTMKAFTPFVVPAMEGGRNMIRNLSSKRGRIVFTGQVAMAMALYGAMRSFAPDDPEQGNAMDAMSLTQMARFIPLFNKDGSYAKLPVSFGMSRMAWITGAGMMRMSNGVYKDPMEGASDLVSNVALAALQEVQPFDYAKDVYADNIASGIILSAVPSIAQPFAEVALNTNHFGGRLHGTAPIGGFASDSARSKTPEVWTDIAVTMQKTFGIDAFPESYRHLINGYALGPARAITTWMEADSNYTMGGKLRTRQEIGPIWDAVGIARYWDNGVTNTERQYYNLQDKYVDVLRKYHVSASNPDNKPGEKAISAYNRILEAGGTDAEAMLVYHSIVAEAEREKLNKQLRRYVKEYKSVDLDLELLSPTYEQHVQEMDFLMKDYIRNVRSIPQ